MIITKRISVILLFVWIAHSAYSQTYQQLCDSLEYATSMLKKFPENTDLRLKKASWNLLLEQWAYAQKEYDHILLADSMNIAALYYRAYTNEKMHRYKFARKDYENMLKIVPGNFNGLLGLALLNQKDMHYTDAMNNINLLIQQYPDSAVAYAARAGIEKERGMYELAEYDFTEAIKRDSKNADYRIARADVRILMGKKKLAHQDLDYLVGLGVPRPSLNDLYARCKE